MPKVLLADLDDASFTQATDILRSSNYVVSRAKFGDVVGQATMDLPDVIIADVKMARAQGGRILPTLRTTFPNTVILVAAFTPDKEVRDALDCGAVDWLSKPFQDWEVRHRLSNALVWAVAGSLPASIDPIIAGSFHSKLLPIHLPLKDLHDPGSGRLDAKRVASYLDVPLSKLAAGLGRPYPTVHKSPSAPSLQPALAPIEKSLETLKTLLGDRSTIRAWLNRAHPDLGDRTPIQVILEGHGEAVSRLLAAAAEGQTS